MRIVRLYLGTWKNSRRSVEDLTEMCDGLFGQMFEDIIGDVLQEFDFGMDMEWEQKKDMIVDW